MIDESYTDFIMVVHCTYYRHETFMNNSKHIMKLILISYLIALMGIVNICHHSFTAGAPRRTPTNTIEIIMSTP